MSDQPPNNEEWQQPQQPPYNEQWHQQSYPQQPYSAYQPNAQQPNPEQWQQSQQPPTNEQWHQQQPNPNYQQYSQQLMYPQQPMYPQQLPKKKSRLWLWIVLGVVGVLVLGCIGVVVAVSSAARSISTTNVSSVETAAATTGTGNTPVPSNSQHFVVGQVVKVGDTWDVTVNSVKTSKGDQYSVPKSGNTYLVIDLSMKNISAQEQDVSSLISFNFMDSTEQKYTESITTMSSVHPPDGKVEAGSPLRGQLVYEVPTSIKDYTLSFQADFTSPGQTIWDIHA